MNPKVPTLILRFVCLLSIKLVFFNVSTLDAQEFPAYNPILTEIGELESVRDPKCHATASRLEDFLYGTPLTFEARKERINFQQLFVQQIWLHYTRALKESNKPSDFELFQSVITTYIQFEETADGIRLQLPSGNTYFIPSRDYRQYSSVAYAYRAILAVQQSCLLSSEDLAPLEGEYLEYFKKCVDIAVLGLLHQADQHARKANSHQITAGHLQSAIQEWNLKPAVSSAAGTTASAYKPSDFIYPVITQKLAAYQAYNKISQALFLRNIQVYFSKIPWPSNQEESDALKAYYTEMMVAFSGEVLFLSQHLAQAEGKSTIAYEHVYQAVQDYLPHTVNIFEDVNYFPRLAPKGNVNIQSYDLDAFRDSGLHWQYLKFALDDRATELTLTPDPFALEMLVEGIAQFAVLIFRMAGADAIAKNQPLLAIENINAALSEFQHKLSDYGNLPPETNTTIGLTSAPETSDPSITGSLFSEISAETGFVFEHRNSDWLSRLIRSYVVKEDENLARLAIPPAFGGSGVAAEDIDGDGWIDLLLLGGKGCELFKNDNGTHFEKKTAIAGINWQRPDGTFPEARQPLVADFDNDGKQDILIINANDDHRMYQNIGDWQFTDKTATAGLGGSGLVAGPSTLIDYDKDGLLDVYIGYFGNYLKGDLPTLKRHNTNGSPNKLFRNLGNFTFEDVSAGSGLENRGWTQAVGHTDINGDGWQDIIVGNDFGINSYYINNQDGTFRDVSAEIGTDKPSYTMNIGVGDINGDLTPDFYISNIVVMEKDDKYVLPNEDTQAHFDPESLASMRVVEANDLFVSNKNGQDIPIFQQATNVGRGYTSTGWSWDADFFDFDNDTDLDLYCLTGMNQYSVYGSENPYYTSPEGETITTTFAKSGAEKNILFENTNGILKVVDENNALAYTGTSRSAAYFDFDKDGDLDIVVNEFQSAARLFRNDTDSNNNWIAVRLIANPKSGNIDAIGAQMVLTLENGQQLWREVHSTDGYLSVHPKTMHFGLGKQVIESLKVSWPDGQTKLYTDLSVNKFHTLTQK